MAYFEKVPAGWRAHVERVGFKRLSKTLPTKAAAEDWATRTESAIFQREHVDRVRTTDTVRDILERFRDEVAPTRKGRRWEVVRIDKFLAEVEFVNRRLDQLMPADIKAWRDQALRRVTPASVNREWNLLSGIFTHAIKEWDAPLRENPMHLAQRPKGKGKERSRRWLEPELKKYLDSCGWDASRAPRVGYEYVPWLVQIAIETAMRLGELCALKIEDVHLKERYVVLFDSKNGDGRVVPLSKKAQELLLRITEGRPSTDPLVPITSGSLSTYFREQRMKAGLVDLRFHDTRHEAATRLSKKFSNVLELSAITGHRSLQSLKRYYNPTPAEMLAKLDA